MGLETGTYISDLVTTNPPNSDSESQGAAHLRLIKSVLQNTFPGSSRAWPLPASSAKTVNFTILSGDFNKLFVVDTTAGSVSATLPTLAAGDAGWTCSFIKTNAGTSPLMIFPPAGTLTSGEISGLASSRRCIPGHRTEAIWTGTAYFLTRVPRVPCGSMLELGLFNTSSLPIGYEWPNGLALSSSAVYPDYFAANGNSLSVPDIRGRYAAAIDSMGAAGAAGRITVAGGNFDGTVAFNNGGGQNLSLLQTHLPNVAPTFNGISQSPSVSFGSPLSSGIAVTGGALGGSNFWGVAGSSPNATVTFTPSGTITSINPGAQTAVPKCPPSLVVPKVLVVE